MKILLASSEVHPYSKTGGLADMAGSLAKALAPAGVYVYCIAPGFVDTEMTQSLPEAARTQMLSAIPLGRAAAATEATREASHPTGKSTSTD